MATATAGKSGCDVRRRRIVENVQLVWVDTIIDSTDPDAQHTLQQLRTVVNEVNIFSHPHRCRDFLEGVNKERVLVITSGSVGRELVPQIHTMRQVDGIYIFCRHKSQHKEWARDYPKIKAVHTRIESICKDLQLAVRQCNRDSTAISIIQTDVNTTNLNQQEASFMYTQLFKDILIDMEFGQRTRQHLVEYVRREYADNQNELNVIDEFERRYHSNEAIWWYSRECFTYQMLNRALRLLEADIIVNMGFFLHDLHRQLEHLHRQQTGRGQWEKRFTVYRGQGLPTEQFDKLKNTKGGLMSFNSFLSTSLNREVSLDNFATEASKKEGMVGILFVMAIDPSISSTPFADIQEHGFFKKKEAEILFSMHTIFRIGAIRDLDSSSQLFEVQLTLTADNDGGLRTLTERINQEVGGWTGWQRIGELLLQVGELSKAEELYVNLLEQTRDQNDEQYYNHQLGCIKDQQGDYEGALKCYYKALEIRQKALPANHPHFAAPYNNIGLVYDNMGKYPEALSFFNKALDIQQKTLPANHPTLATCYNNIGQVYGKMGEHPKALSFYEKTLHIRQQTLPANHPDLAGSYNNIGLVYFDMAEYPESLSFYNKAFDIFQKTLPANHPNLATSYNNIGQVYCNMAEYPEALSFFNKAIDIFRKTLPTDHPDLAGSYNNIGGVYFNMAEYPESLSFYNKAFDIFQKTLPANHPNLATSYNNIGQVYCNMAEYPEALSFFNKAIDIFRKTLPTDHPDLAGSYNNIGLVYSNMAEYPESLSFFNKAIDIFQKTLPADHPNLATSYNNIGLVYDKIGEYPEALTSFQKALSICERALPPTHPLLLSVREWIETVKQNL